MLVGLGSLVVYHVQLICRNYTTYEQFKSRFSIRRKVSPYSHGFVANCVEVSSWVAGGKALADGPTFQDALALVLHAVAAWWLAQQAIVVLSTALWFKCRCLPKYATSLMCIL